MCNVLELNRSTYYKDSKRKLTKTQINNNELDSKILKVYYDSKRRYGAPKIFKVLRNEGETASLKRIQRRMTVLGIKSVVVKKYKPVKAEKNIEQKENILNQDFSTTSINQKWSTDITYIHTENEGWTYLASVEDLYSRKIIGWAFGKTIDAELAVRALKNAVLNVKHTEGIIIQSDLGCQYTSNLFESALAELKIRHSYSKKGYPYDNSCIESFHSVLKKEEVNLRKYKDSKAAYDAVFEYIESWYNRKRIHSSLNYRTPEAVHSECEKLAA
jgi:transposase